MRTGKFIILVILVKGIRSEISNNNLFRLCDSAKNVEYENYTATLIQNCGCKEESTCVRKCCRNGFIHYHDEDLKNGIFISVCKKQEMRPFNVPIYDGKVKVHNITEPFVVGMLNCNNDGYQYFKMDNTDPDQKFYIQKNGSLYYPFYEKMYTNERYCIDEEDSLTAYVCFTPKDPKYKIEGWIHVSAKLVSVPFLLVTGLVYTLLPERNLYKNALMNHVWSLIPGNLLLALGQYFIIIDDIEDNVLCAPIGFLALFCLISSFLWMNVICIDIWMAFSGFRGFYIQERIKRWIFTIASLYAWGLPGLYVLIIFLLNTYITDKDASYYPGVGVDFCFLSGWSTITYYFGPVLVLIVINLVMFLITAFNIQKAKKEAGIVENSDSRRHSTRDDDRFKLYWKLLFVMGLNPMVNTHVIQLIAYSLGRNIPHDTVVYILYFKDLSHACYGIIVFVIFVCQKRIWLSLKDRFNCMGKTSKHKTSVTTSSGTASGENPSGMRLRGIRNLGADVP